MSGIVLLMREISEKSCKMKAFTPISRHSFMQAITSSYSLCLYIVLKVTYTLTPKKRQNSTAFFSSSMVKLPAFALALNLVSPRYTASAPFITAHLSDSKLPAGASTSVFLSENCMQFAFKSGNNLFHNILNFAVYQSMVVVTQP